MTQVNHPPLIALERNVLVLRFPTPANERMPSGTQFPLIFATFEHYMYQWIAHPRRKVWGKHRIFRVGKDRSMDYTAPQIPCPGTLRQPPPPDPSQEGNWPAGVAPFLGGAGGGFGGAMHAKSSESSLPAERAQRGEVPAAVVDIRQCLAYQVGMKSFSRLVFLWCWLVARHGLWAADAPATFKVSEFTFTRPAAWEWVESASRMRKAQLRVVDATTKAKAE